MIESNVERERVGGSRFAKPCVLDPLTFDLQNGKNDDFVCENAIKPDFSDKPKVGNLSKGLDDLKESNVERERVRGSKFGKFCVLNARVDL